MENKEEIESVIQRIKQKCKEKNITMNHVVSKESVEIFENNYRITLPEEFKQFYTEIGNGCQVMLDEFPLRRLEDIKSDVGDVQLEFPYENSFIWGNDLEQEQIEYAYHGNMELIDIGCGETWNLIVTGKEKGQMWSFCEVGIQPCAPKLSFLEWFEFWLDGKTDYFQGYYETNS